MANEEKVARLTGNGSILPNVDASDGAGMYLYWEGRKNYRPRMPAPRVLEPVKRYATSTLRPILRTQGAHHLQVRPLSRSR